MAQHNFPKTEKEFHAWFSNFQQSFASNYKKYGFKPSDAASVNRWYKSWQNSYNFWNSFNQFSSWYSKFHTTEFANFKSFLVSYWSQIQSNPKWDGNWKNWFGVTAPKTTGRTTKSTGSKKTSGKRGSISGSSSKKSSPKSGSPTVWLDYKGGKLYLYAGSSKAGGFKLPTSAKNCTFEYKTETGAWRKLYAGTKPYAITSSSNKKVYYRAYWTNSDGTKGTYSKPVAFDWSSTKTGFKKAA